MREISEYSSKKVIEIKELYTPTDTFYNMCIVFYFFYLINLRYEDINFLYLSKIMYSVG